MSLSSGQPAHSSAGIVGSGPIGERAFPGVRPGRQTLQTSSVPGDGLAVEWGPWFPVFVALWYTPSPNGFHRSVYESSVPCCGRWSSRRHARRSASHRVRAAESAAPDATAGDAATPETRRTAEVRGYGRRHRHQSRTEADRYGGDDERHHERDDRDGAVGRTLPSCCGRFQASTSRRYQRATSMSRAAPRRGRWPPASSRSSTAARSIRTSLAS